MCKKAAALLLTLILMMTSAAAEIAWPENPTGGQLALRTFVDTANEALATMDAGCIDVRYEMYATFASLGMDGQELPEDPLTPFELPVEMYFMLNDQGIKSLTLRVNDVYRFAPIAAACLHAASPQGVPLAQARSYADSYAAIAISDHQALQRDPKAPTHSYEEEPSDQQGSQPRAFFAYYPDQYGDGVTWLQMTLIFPLPGYSGSLLISATPPPQAEDDMYEGYFAEDSYPHLEVFVTPSPEPDSAAME